MKEFKLQHQNLDLRLFLDLHLFRVRGSIQILVPGRFRKAFDLGTNNLTKGVDPITQLHPVDLRLGYALIYVVEA